MTETSGPADDQTLSDLDQTQSDADQTQSDADQTASEADQIASDQDQRLAERDQHASDQDQAAADRNQAKTGTDTSSARLVDARPQEEFEGGHIEGARSLPLDHLDERLRELPSEAEVIAYCRGPFCPFANEAVRRLRAAGSVGSRRAGRSGSWPRAARRAESSTQAAA